MVEPVMTPPTNKQVIPQHRLKIVRTTVRSLKEHPGNPRKGNVKAIVESLRENGQYRPIVVQKSTRRVLAGNHTLQAARALGWEDIDAVFVDVDDTAAKRIMLADNRTNDLASYDTELLLKVIQSIPTVVGTGYTDDDVAALTRAVQLDTSTAHEQIVEILHPELEPADEEITPGAFKDEVVLEEETVEEFKDVLGSAPTTLPGAVQLSHDFDWHGKVATGWQIPVLSASNLVQVEDLPASIMTYVPRMHRDWPDDEQGWLLIARSGNTAGLKQPQNSIMSFYTYDSEFDGWWFEYQERTTQMLNTGIKMAVSPNWSMFDTSPLAESLWALYRSRWLGRYWQECGVKVIPDMQPGPTDDFLNNYVLPTLPSRCPVVATQRQFHNDMTRKIIQDYHKRLRIFYERVKPEVCIVYASDEGCEIIRQAGLGWDIVSVELFSTLMRDYKLAAKLRNQAEMNAAGRSARSLTQTDAGIPGSRVRKRSPA